MDNVLTFMYYVTLVLHSNPNEPFMTQTQNEDALALRVVTEIRLQIRKLLFLRPEVRYLGRHDHVRVREQTRSSASYR